MSSQSIDSTRVQKEWTKALLWKELRQVVPLLLTVLGLGFGILLMCLITWAFSSQKSLKYDNGFWFLFLSMPMMYATGVGILLVGAEKESRSLNWIRSLPVSSRHIAWNKLVVALATLALVWLIALTAWAVFAGLLGGNPLSISSIQLHNSDSGRWLLPTYLMVSLFLCLAGLAFAWRFESQVLSLAMLVPAALAVWLPTYGIVAYLGVGRTDLATQRFLESGLYLFNLALGCAIISVYGWRTSQRELAALPAPAHESNSGGVRWPTFGLKNISGARQEETAAEAWSLWPSVSPISGMLWQMIRQSWRWWSLIAIAFLIMLVISSYLYIFNGLELVNDDWVGFLFLPTLLLSGILGVLAFQSDGIQQRVKFYADRGVSPTLLWCTRHWIPVTLLLVMAIVRYLTLNHGEFRMVDTMALLAGSLAAYSVGQWVSQYIKSPILAAITLPAVLIATLAYCIFAVAAMEAPWWLLAPSFLVLGVSTWWMMRAWMERRIDWKYNLQHGGFVFAALLIPLLPGLWKIWNLPSMPGELRVKLEQLATKNHEGTWLRQSISTSYLSSTSDSKLDQIQARLDRNEFIRENQRQSLLQQASQPDFWIANTNSETLLKTYMAELASLQGDLPATTTDLTGESSRAMERYRQAIGGIPQLVQGLRASKILKYCDIAEKIELVALGQCLHPKAREWMGKEVYESVAALLADDRSRDDSRRTALANAWTEVRKYASRKEPAHAYGLGGYALSYYPTGIDRANYGAIPSTIKMLRSRDLYVTELWKLLDTPIGSAEGKAFRQKSQRQSFAGPTDLIDGFTVIGFPLMDPAPAWRGEWESIAKNLVKEGESRE